MKQEYQVGSITDHIFPLLNKYTESHVKLAMTTVLEVSENKRIIYAPYPDENSPKDDKDLQVFSFLIFFCQDTAWWVRLLPSRSCRWLAYLNYECT